MIILGREIVQKGRAKRGPTFRQVLRKSDNFFYARSSYGFNKYEAKGLLIDNCRHLGLTYAEAVTLNCLIKLTSFKSWMEGSPVCTASNLTISEDAGLAKTTIPNCLRHLEDKGFIIRNYDEETNQRIGDEPISVAPFASMLPELADKELIEYVVTRREKMLGRSLKAQEITVPPKDQEVYSAEQELQAIYGINESGLDTVQSELTELEANGQYSLWDYMDSIIEKEKVASNKIIDSVKKRSLKEVMLALLNDLKAKMPKFGQDVLIKTHKRLSAKKRSHEIPMNILYILYGKKEIDNKARYLGGICSNLTKLKDTSICINTLSSAFIEKQEKAKRLPTLEELKGMFKYDNFTKHKELLSLIKHMSDPFPAVFRFVMFKDNTLLVRGDHFYNKFKQCLSTYRINLKVVKDMNIPFHNNNIASA